MNPGPHGPELCELSSRSAPKIDFSSKCPNGRRSPSRVGTFSARLLHEVLRSVRRSWRFRASPIRSTSRDGAWNSGPDALGPYPDDLTTVAGVRQHTPERLVLRATQSELAEGCDVPIGELDEWPSRWRVTSVA